LFQRKVLDGSLGFAAGVMLAASFWSLLAPAIEMAKNSGNKFLHELTDSKILFTNIEKDLVHYLKFLI